MLAKGENVTVYACCCVLWYNEYLQYVTTQTQRRKTLVQQKTQTLKEAQQMLLAATPPAAADDADQAAVHTAAQSVVAAVSASKRCLTPGCTDILRSRGLCPNCYGTASLRVRSGLATWKELEALGLALPSKQEQGAFAAALKKQLGVEKAAREQHEAHAENVALLNERQDDQSPTLEEIRELAAKVARNPSAENLHLLAEMSEGRRLPQPETPPQPPTQPLDLSVPELYDEGENTKSEVELPSDDMPPGYVPDVAGIVQPQSRPESPPVALSKLPDNMAWTAGPNGEPVPRVLTPEEQMVIARTRVLQKRKDLRERSLADAKALATGQPLVEVDGGCDDDGMSDEEFNRTLQASEMRRREDGAIDPALPQTPKPNKTPYVSMEMMQKAVAPTFTEPELPTDLAYDPSLDGSSSESVTSVVGPGTVVQMAKKPIVPVNPISTEG